jgi:LDH2 family malate/lactate/ureidoglycolate dehydrogenase
VLDFATSGVAEGKLRVARAKGTRIPEGVVVDSNGHPSQDPGDFYAGGALQTFGLHKGSGMSVMIELLARGLCGVDPTQSHPIGQNGPLILALNIPFLGPEAQFYGAAERLREQVTACAPMPGFDSVLAPGDPERHARQRRIEAGIPIPQTTWDAIMALAAEWNVSI